MKKYMVIFVEDGAEVAYFYDSIDDAENARMNATCGLGAYCEVYERTGEGPEKSYKLLYV